MHAEAAMFAWAGPQVAAVQTDALAHPDQTEPGLLLWLALAAIAVVEHVDLERALALAPQMAADARLAEAPDVEEVATAVCWAADGPAQRLTKKPRGMECAAYRGREQVTCVKSRACRPGSSHHSE